MTTEKATLLLHLIPEAILRGIFWSAIANDREFDDLFLNGRPPEGCIWKLRNDLCQHIMDDTDLECSGRFIERLDFLISLLPCSQNVHLDHVILAPKFWNDVAFGIGSARSELGI